MSKHFDDQMDTFYQELHKEWKSLEGDPKFWFECDHNYSTDFHEDATGWIGPKGEFLGCQFGMHTCTIQIFGGMREVEAERLGWIKVCQLRGIVLIAHNYDPTIPKPTRAQRRMINQLAYYDSMESDK